MGIMKRIWEDQMALSDLVEAIKHDYEEQLEHEVFIDETVRTMRDYKGRFTSAYGELWRFDDKHNVFVPSLGSQVDGYLLEPVANVPAPVKAEPLGYHNLTTDDL